MKVLKLVVLFVAVVGCDREIDVGPGAPVGGSCSGEGCHPGAVVEEILKASNEGVGDLFGAEVVVSADGSTLAIGAPAEDSGASGVNGSQGNDSAATDSGAVYVFRKQNGRWQQEAYIKGPSPKADDGFGSSIALSADGSTMAVSPILGYETKNEEVYVFQRQGVQWFQQAVLDVVERIEFSTCAASVSFSGDGKVLAVGNPCDSSRSSLEGAASLFTHEGGNRWSQVGFFEGKKIEGRFGSSLALSQDGTRMAVGYASGKVSLYAFVGSQWVQEDFIPECGRAGRMALSASGRRMAITCAQGRASSLSLSDITQSEVRVYERRNNVWVNDSGFKALYQEKLYPAALSFSADGNRLAIGVIGTQASEVFVHQKVNDAWGEPFIVKPSDPADSDFGTELALSNDGQTLYVGAPALGVTGNAPASRGTGTVYIFEGL